MDTAKERIIEIARFTHPADAQILMSILRSEGIECYLRDEFSSQLLVGGARLDILESNRESAVEIVRKSGYERYLTSGNNEG
jgi:hypothetical protein